MIIENNSEKWIAVYTKPRHEKTVSNELHKKGYEVYLPLLKERRKWSDRKKWVEFPLFKSYLFVKTDIKNSLSVVQSYGVVKIIKFGEKVGIVQNEIIDSIRLMIEGGYKPEPLDYFIEDDPVIVKERPLKGLIGELVRVNNKERLIVRIDAIQHSVSIQIERGFLKTYNSRNK